MNGFGPNAWGGNADPNPTIISGAGTDEAVDDLRLDTIFDAVSGGRGLSATQEGQVEAAHATATHLVELVFWDGSSESTVRLTTAGQPIDATVDVGGTDTEVTFAATGGVLQIGGIQETADDKAQGTQLKLSGLDSSILDPLLAQDFRGRRARIWRCWWDESAGTVLDEPLLLGDFRQMDSYEISETPPDFGAPGTVEITTRVVSPLALAEQTNTVRCTVESHNAMLARLGAKTGDTFWQNLPKIVNKRIRWGSGDTPDTGGQNVDTNLLD